jgi:hypothetical protein
MNIFAFVGVNLGVLSLLAITPIQKPTLNDGIYKSHLFMLDMGNWEREMKERSWAAVQPCVNYELPTVEETAEPILAEGSEADTKGVTQFTGQSDEFVTTVETEEESSATTPLYRVGDAILDEGIQVYLYQRLSEVGIAWFMPYAILIAYGESRFNPLAENANGRDKGLLQYRVELVPWMDWRNPYQQIDCFVSQMANRANAGVTVSDMISRHNVSDYGAYNQSYVDYIMSYSGLLMRIR